MINISSKLSTNLSIAIRNADELWIAVALLNSTGLNSILKVLKKDCKINFIGGIDLPTEPSALTKILALKTRHAVSAFIHTKETFHPKVYIINSGGLFRSFIGSANCTSGGLENNIEMTIEIEDQNTSKELIKWFNKIKDNSQILTSEFIAEYTPSYKRRIKGRGKIQKDLNNFKKREEVKLQAYLEQRDALISKLKAIRRSKDYSTYKPARYEIIKKLKKALDYPKFLKLDLSTFWNIKHLGTIVPIRVKAKIENEPLKFSKLMRYICDESVSINTRIDEALYGNLSIENISIGFISKVLVMHNPDEYYIHNKEFNEIFKPFGLSFPRGLSIGDKYQLTRDTLRNVLKVTDIENFAVLDQCLLNL